MVVWVLVVMFAGKAPVVVDNIASKKACDEAALTMIYINSPPTRSTPTYICTAVTKSK